MDIEGHPPYLMLAKLGKQISVKIRVRLTIINMFFQKYLFVVLLRGFYFAQQPEVARFSLFMLVTCAGWMSWVTWGTSRV